MSRFAIVGLVVALLGCGDKEKECAAKKKAAADAVVGAVFTIDSTRDDAKRAVDEAKQSIAVHADDEPELEKRIKLFEQSMDCLVMKDCCKRLVKFDNHQTAMILQIASSIAPSTSDDPLPLEVARAIAPLTKLMEDNGGYFSAYSKEMPAICEKARVEVARIRKEAPAAWAASREATKQDLATKQAALDTAQKYSDALTAWATAIKKGEKAAIDPALDEGGSARYRETATTVAAYNAACH